MSYIKSRKDNKKSCSMAPDGPFLTKNQDISHILIKYFMGSRQVCLFFVIFVANVTHLPQVCRLVKTDGADGGHWP